MRDPRERETQRLGPTLDLLRARLARRERAVRGRDGAIACAVLVPVVVADDGLSVVYTVRSEHVPNHKGQVSFPGGKHSPGDDASLLDTALREAHEEIGIRPGIVEVLGELDDVCTMATDFVITPYVGLIAPDTRYRVNRREVDDVFTVALHDLGEPSRHTKEIREWRGQSFEVDAIAAGPHRIWGATRTITLNLLECVAGPAR